MSAAATPLTVPLDLSHVGDMPMHFSVTSDVFWLSATPATGTVASGATVQLTIRADPRGRQPRPYHGAILIDAHDSRNGPVRIPITMAIPSLSPPAGLHAWGAGSPYEWGQTLVPSGAVDAVQIAAGAFHSLAVLSNGTLLAWGRDDEGQRTIPAEVSGVAAAAGGIAHSIALQTDGSLVAWGRGEEGQTNVPAGVTNAMAVAAGGHSSAALLADGTVAVWGQITNVAPASLTSTVEIAVGGRHVAVLLRDGSVVTWGAGDRGQTNVPGGLRAVSIAAGADHTVAVKADGTVVAWGRGDEGQTNAPPGLSNVVFATAGEMYSAARKEDGTVSIWGTDTGGVFSVPSVTGAVAFAGGYAHAMAMFPARHLVVESAHGISVPSAGTHRLLRDAPVAVSVPSPIEAGGTQHVATGWVRIGSEPGSGMGTSVVFALGTDTTQTWVWATNYWLAAGSGSAGGSVSPTGGWFALNATAAVMAVEATYHHWTHWEGDIDDTVRDGSVLSVPMAGPRDVTAFFAPNLAAFGVPQAWLAQYGWSNEFDVAAGGDTDGDSAPAWEEWAADTDPTNAASVLRVGTIWVSDGVATLEWSGGASRTQFIDHADGLADSPWAPLHTNLPPTAATNTFSVPITNNGVFRIRVPVP